jgi:hypothetical protein
LIDSYYVLLFNNTMKNIKLRRNKEYNINHLTDENFWKRKEPKYVILYFNVNSHTLRYENCLQFGIYHIRQINFLRRCMIWKIMVKQILDLIRPLNIDLIQYQIFKLLGCPDPYILF